MSYADTVLARSGLLAYAHLDGPATYAGTGVALTQADTTALTSAELGSAFTVQATVTVDSTGADGAVVGAFNDAAANNPSLRPFLLYMDAGSGASYRTLVGGLASGGSTYVSTPEAPSGYSVAADTPAIVRVVWTGRYLRLYVDGVKRAESDAGASYVLSTANRSFALGADDAAGLTLRGLYGTLENVAVYSVAWSDAEVEADYAALTGGEPEPTTGSAEGIAPAATGYATGTVGHVGTAQATAPAATGAASGTVTHVGTAAAAAPVSSGAASGTVTHTGTVQAVAPAATAQVLGSGTITGTAQAVAPATIATVRGVVTHTGTVQAVAPVATAYATDAEAAEPPAFTALSLTLPYRAALLLTTPHRAALSLSLPYRASIALRP